MRLDVPPRKMTRWDNAGFGAFMLFPLGALIGSGVPEIMGASQDIPAIFGAGAAMGLCGAICGYLSGDSA